MLTGVVGQHPCSRGWKNWRERSRERGKSPSRSSRSNDCTCAKSSSAARLAAPFSHPANQSVCGVGGCTATGINGIFIELGQLGKGWVPGMTAGAFAKIMGVSFPTGKFYCPLFVQKSQQHPMSNPDGAPHVTFLEHVAGDLQGVVPVGRGAFENLPACRARRRRVFLSSKKQHVCQGEI